MFWSEVKHACRLLWRSPAFALLATLILALSIGANTALFSVVNSVLLSPLPYSQPEEIVAVNTKFPDSGREHRRVTGGDFFDIAAEMRSLEAISYYFGGEMGVQVGEAATFTGAYLVNPGFFQVFAVSPVLGRLFTSDTADEHTAVVSAGFAQRHFGSARGALGKRLSLEAEAYEIVGIVAGLDFPKDAAVWLPAPLKPTNSNRSAYNYSGVARLREGTPIEAAQAEIGQLAGRLALAYPDVNKNKTFILTPLRDQMVSNVRSTLQLLMAAVSLVLLTACANIANLLLARATGRSREMAVRAAIGASRWAIVRQLLAESLVLALAGGAAGCLLAYLLIGALPSIAPANLPRLAEVKVDMTAMLFALIASIAASILFGLVPSLQASRADLNEALRQGGRGTTAGSPRLRSALVVAEVALSIVLAIGAGLLFRSFLALNDVNLGYRTDGMLVMYAHAPAHSDAEYIATSKRFEQLFGELKTIPGVTSAAGVMGLPTGRYGSNGSYAVEGKSEFRPGVKLPNAGFRLASAGYFSTMGVPLLRGRDFDSRDQFDATPVAIISDALAKQSFSGEDPIGKRIMCGLDSPEWMTIVGVVGDVRQDSPAASPAPELYMPLNQHPSRANEIQVVVRTAVAPASVISAVQQKTEAMSNGVATKFTTLDAMVADSMALPRFRTWLIGAFAFLSLALAVAGVYSVMTYTVAQRTSEMGVRMALGADGADVLLLILGRAAALTAVGVVIGVAAAIAGSHIVKTMVFGLAPTDVGTYVFVAGVVAATTLAAAAIPAWRATRIDPVSALRQE